jgi:hypothetical protein
MCWCVSINLSKAMVHFIQLQSYRIQVIKEDCSAETELSDTSTMQCVAKFDRQAL